MTQKSIIWIVVAVVVLGLLGWFVFGNPAPANAPTESNTESNVPSATSPKTSDQAPAPKTVTVTYSDSGFSPALIELSAGDTVKFVNASSRNMWVGANQHPTHGEYDGSTRSAHCIAGYDGPAPFDACEPVQSGSSWSFTFTKRGTWGYHDHINASAHGTVVVSGT